MDFHLWPKAVFHGGAEVGMTSSSFVKWFSKQSSISDGDLVLYQRVGVHLKIRSALVTRLILRRLEEILRPSDMRFRTKYRGSGV